MELLSAFVLGSVASFLQGRNGIPSWLAFFMAISSCVIMAGLVLAVDSLARGEELNLERLPGLIGLAFIGSQTLFQIHFKKIFNGKKKK